MPQINRISKSQCLFRFFEGAVWEQDAGSFRTHSITKNIVNRPEITRQLAPEISQLQDRINQHWALHAQRRARTPQTPIEDVDIHEPSQEEIDKQIAQLLGGDIVTPIQTPTPSTDINSGIVHQSQIELIEINDTTSVNGSVFPRSFICPYCGHYEIINPQSPSDLICHCCPPWCPECQTEIEDKSLDACIKCGTRLIRRPLRQYNLVFACPRCANIEEFTPHIRNLGQLTGGPITCPTCNSGHLHLNVSTSISNIAWRCSNPACHFNERLSKFCKCHIPSTDGQPGAPSIMKPSPISASITVPLAHTYLWLGTEDVDIGSLNQFHTATQEDDPYSWKMSNSVLEPQEIQMIRGLYSIEDSFSVPKIQTTTVVYGYISGISSFPSEINDAERLPHFFTDGKAQMKYRAYLANTTGRGLVIQLSKDKLLNILEAKSLVEPGTKYEDLAERCCAYLSTGSFQEIVSSLGPVYLAELLHAYEHAIFKTAVSQVGLEVFGSKILIKDAAIILYEREEVGPGGLVQLTNSDQFIRLLRGVKNVLWDCPQDCESACPACLYINDYYCQPFMPKEVSRWLPPNVLLDRNLARGTIKGARR